MNELQENPNIPQYMKYLFWDTDFSKLDNEKYWFYIIERAFQLGRPEQIRWIELTYNEEQIKEVVKKSKILDRKTVNFWCLIYSIKREETVCFTKQYPNLLWEY